MLQLSLEKLLVAVVVGYIAYLVAGIFVKADNPKMARVPLIIGLLVSVLVYFGVILVV